MSRGKSTAIYSSDELAQFALIEASARERRELQDQLADAERAALRSMWRGELCIERDE